MMSVTRMATLIGIAGVGIAACGQVLAFEVTGTAKTKIDIEELGSFEFPWAMTFLPDGRMLITERTGIVWLASSKGANRKPVGSVPDADIGGQGGMGDVIVHPQFDQNRFVYLSFVEPGPANTSGAVVARAKLQENAAGPFLEDSEIIWRQTPKVSGRGHYSHKMAFSPDGKLFITSGDRQKLDPAQDLNSDLGKIIRLNEDGTVPADNPWNDKKGVAGTFWSLGHRNLLGFAFAPDGTLWQHEMGPRHGDELNVVHKGKNYGWPLVSNGNHYSGQAIPDHDTRPEFEAPKAYWVPSIAPSGLVIYTGTLFENWSGDALIGGLASQALIRVDIEGETAAEVERFAWGERIREVEQAPDGSVHVLEDGDNGRLLQIRPAK